MNLENFNIYAFAFIMVGWIISVCFHEFSHALVAYIGGDKSVKDKGYLTFNPLKYTHPTLSILYPILFLIIGGIGLPGGAVYINTAALRNRLWNSATSLAGPLANLVLLAILIIPFRYGMADIEAQPVFWSAYAFLCFLQLTSVFLNMIPIPPLDGFGTISAFMGQKLRNRIYAQSQMFLFVFIILMLNVEAFASTFWETIFMISNNIGVPPDLVFDGIKMMHLNIFGNLTVNS